MFYADALFYMVIACYLFLGWVFTCNNNTLTDRQWLIKCIYSSKDWQFLSMQFSRVPYDRHVFQRLLFRNPWKIYPRGIQELVKRNCDDIQTAARRTR